MKRDRRAVVEGKGQEYFDTRGTNSTLIGIMQNSVNKVFVAKDADDFIVAPIIEACENFGIEYEYVNSKRELANRAGLPKKVSCAVAGKRIIQEVEESDE